MVIQKSAPALYRRWAYIYPHHTNCACLAYPSSTSNEGYNLLETLFNGIGAAAGFALAIILFAGIRERQEYADIPKPSAASHRISLRRASCRSRFLASMGLIK